MTARSLRELWVKVVTGKLLFFSLVYCTCACIFSVVDRRFITSVPQTPSSNLRSLYLTIVMSTPSSEVRDSPDRGVNPQCCSRRSVAVD